MAERFRSMTQHAMLRATVDAPVSPRSRGVEEQRSAKILRGVSMITRGEHRGHGAWGDAALVQRVVDLCNAAPSGIKARFAHPGLSNDGIGTFLGRFRNARVEGDCAVADLHLSESARNSPNGDLVEYVTGLAQDDPKAFATSVVYERDQDAWEEFHLARGAYWDEDGFMGTFLNLEKFQSPDPDNTDNLPHDFVSSLHACDVVDEPAANPGGLFAPVASLGAGMESVAKVALGLAPAETCTVALGHGLTARGARSWTQDFLKRNGLEIRKTNEAASPLEDSDMTVKKNQKRAEPAPEEKAALAVSEEPETEPKEKSEGEVDEESASYKAGKSAGYEEGYAEGEKAAKAAKEADPVEEERSASPATLEMLELLPGSSSDFVVEALKAKMTELGAAKKLLSRLASAPAVNPETVPAALRSVPGLRGAPAVVVDTRDAGGGAPANFAEALDIVRAEAATAKRALKPGEDANIVKQRWPELYAQASA